MSGKKTESTITFFDISYSVAGRSGVEAIFKSLEQIDTGLLAPREREVLETMLASYTNDGVFPSWAFLQERFGVISNAPIRNMGDFNLALTELLKRRIVELMKMEASNATYESETPEEYAERLSKIIDKNKGASVSNNNISLYTSAREQYMQSKMTAMSGMTSGIECVDTLTAGFQEGTIVSVAGFTSQGKSTVSNNMAYLNALDGRKVAVVSLEIVALLCKYIYLSRHSYTFKNVINYQEIIRGHLTKEREDTLWDHIEKDFMERVGQNLAIIGLEDIPAFSEVGFKLLYQQLDEALDGVEMIIWDHVNQFKYVNFEGNQTGDHCISWITNLTKTFVNKKGRKPVSVLVTQTNREGYKAAQKKGGKYELTALQDFNEVEKSATYVIFTYADEQMRDSGQAKIQLLKHRLGMIQVEPEIIDINFGCSMVGDEYKSVIATMAPGKVDSVAEEFLTSSTAKGFAKENNASDVFTSVDPNAAPKVTPPEASITPHKAYNELDDIVSSNRGGHKAGDFNIS